MKGFLKWFKSSTKVKRWMFLILVGIILACYGMAKIIVSQELEFIDLAKIIAIFVVGFVCIILGIILPRNMSVLASPVPETVWEVWSRSSVRSSRDPGLWLRPIWMKWDLWWSTSMTTDSSGYGRSEVGGAIWFWGSGIRLSPKTAGSIRH